jgi:hypothetical protein
VHTPFKALGRAIDSDGQVTLLPTAIGGGQNVAA